jgi:parallel beta-helix repeat protein
MRRLLSIVVALGLVLSFSLVTALPALAVPEVWVDYHWTSQADVDLYDDTLTWQTDAFATIQDGIDAADLGSATVHVAAGTYYENIDLRNGVDVLGAGADVTIIDAGGSGHVVNSDAVGPSTTIDGFTITGGDTDYGAGVYNDGGSPVVSNCIITGNDADTHGGGMYILNTSSPVVVNCVFYNNTAALRGGGIYVSVSAGHSPTFTNCTIANNAASQGGGIFAGNTSPTITNTIIASNTATTGEGIYCNSGTLLIDYNDVYNNDLVNCTSTNDPAANPVFFGGGDYHLQASSNCIDVGNNTAPSIPATDFEGEPRIFDGDLVPGAVVDIGADEYFVNNPPDDPINLDPPEYRNGSTVTDDTPTLTSTQNDPDGDDIQFTIQIDDDPLFGSPAVDNTSVLLPNPGADNFTSPSLPDGAYYWRVMSTDQWGATSLWTYANGGAVAFQLDTTPVGGGTVGGTVYPIDKTALLLPWLGLVLVLAAGGLILIRRAGRLR